MTAKTRADLLIEINNNLADNNIGAITPAIERQVDTDINDSMFNPLSDNITGDVTTNHNLIAVLNTVNANVGTYGNAAYVPQLTVNAKGLITAAANVAIAATGALITGILANTAMPALTGDVTNSAGAVATTIEKIQGTTVAGVTGTGNVVFSASPTLTGTLTANVLTLSGVATGPSFSANSSSVPANGLYKPNSNGQALSANSAAALVANYYSGSGTPVNYVQASNAGAGFGPIVEFVGADSNIFGNFCAQGAGGFSFSTNGPAQNFALAIQLSILHTASASNHLTITGSNGGAPALSTSGGDLSLSSSTANIQSSASLTFTAAAKGIVLKRGSNGKCGTFVCNGVTPVTVSNTSIAITDTISVSLNTVGGTVGALPAVQTITASSGFTIAGTALDTSTYNYTIISNAA